MFGIDFKDIIRRVLPWFMRTDNTLRYLDAPAAVLKDINDQLLVFRTNTRFYVSVTPQTIYLEYYLNLLYDIFQSRIYIENISDPLAQYVDNVSEARPPDFWVYNKTESPDTSVDNPIGDPVYFFNNSEADSEFDYIIHVPTVLGIDADEIRSRINVYNLAGMRYNIVYF